MKAFQDYAGYYDAIYKDKAYAEECDFIESILKKHSSVPVEAVLDIGCGTGGHSLILAKRGYSVVGVDLSERMLSEARRKAAAGAVALELLPADIRRLSLGRSFDAVVSMFAVMSYQTTDEDVDATLGSVREHLRGGGLFVFDVWFGPAVLAERPEERVKTFELDGGERVVRTARPVLDIDKQTVEVNYTLKLWAGDSLMGAVEEAHLMRYFFPRDIERLLVGAGFETLSISPFGSIDRPASEKDWNVTVVAKANSSRGG